jgi:hypothetical protein
MVSKKPVNEHGGAREGAGRPPAPKRQKRGNRIMVNLTDAEYRDLSAQGKRVGLSASQYLLKLWNESRSR